MGKAILKTGQYSQLTGDMQLHRLIIYKHRHHFANNLISLDNRGDCVLRISCFPEQHSRLHLTNDVIHHLTATSQKSFAGITDKHRHEKQTHLPPALAGALTLVSRSEAEAAGTAVKVGGVKIEGTFPTGITPDTSNVSLQNMAAAPGEKESEKEKTKQTVMCKREF